MCRAVVRLLLGLVLLSQLGCGQLALGVWLATQGGSSGSSGGSGPSAPAPALTFTIEVSPPEGPTLGGTRVTARVVTGLDAFTGISEVTVGGQRATQLRIEAPDRFSFETPARASGNLSGGEPLVATSTSGGRASNAQFAYQAVAPTLSGISPGLGAATGGTALTLSGSGFVPGTRVYVGWAQAGSVSVASDSQLTCLAPPHSSTSTVDVRVVHPEGLEVTLIGGFIYTPPPPGLTFGVQPATATATPRLPLGFSARHYAFEEAAGTVAGDTRGVADAQLVNGPTWTTGVLGGALEFDGVDDHVLAGTLPALGVDDDYSLSFWVLRRASGNDQAVIVGGYDTFVGARLGLVNAGLVYDTTQIVPHRLPLGRWLHVAIIKDGANVSLFQDGAQVGAATVSTGIGASDLRFGGLHLVGWNNSVVLDEVKLFDRVLTADEVMALGRPALTRSLPTVQVQLTRDGALDTGANVPVAISLGQNPGGASLGGTTTVTSAGGVATFSDLRLDRSGAGYTLVANASGYSAGVSNAFTVDPGAPSELRFMVAPPASAVAGQAFPPVEVEVRDAAGNRVPGTAGAVSVELRSHAIQGKVRGGAAVTIVDGVATFADLAIETTGRNFHLAATSTGLFPAVSGAIQVESGIADRLGFLIQPGAANTVAPLASHVVVEVRDAYGNRASGSTAPVTLSLGANPGGATLTGGDPVAAVAGLARFGGVRLDQPGNGYTLVAMSPGLAAAVCAPFEVRQRLLRFDMGLVQVLPDGSTEFALGDLNEDGVLDVVALQRSPFDTLTVHLGQGDGRFGPGTTHPTGRDPTGVALADLNRDGDLDVVVANRLSDDVSVLLGDGLGGLGSESRFGVGANPLAFRLPVGDLNGDDILDVAVPNALADTFSVLLGDGSGGFLPQAQVRVLGRGPRALDMADFDLDGDLDIVSADYTSNEVSLYQNDGRAGFGEPLRFAVGDYPTDVVARDVDGDGDFDVVVGNLSVVLVNQGNWSWATQVHGGLSAAELAVEDFNQDRLVDVALGTGNGFEMAFGREPAPRFDDPVSLLFGASGATQLQAGDADQNGASDLLGTRFDQRLTTILNRGLGDFVGPAALASFQRPKDVVCHDLNGDSRTDILALTQQGLEVFLAQPTGGFTALPVIGTSGYPVRAIAVGRVDLDAAVDVITTVSLTDDVFFYRGLGDGTFAPRTRVSGLIDAPGVPLLTDLDGGFSDDLVIPSEKGAFLHVEREYGIYTTDYPLGGNPGFVQAGDLNGDTLIDLVVTIPSANTVEVLFASSPGVFQAPVSFACGTDPGPLVVGQVDGQAGPDLVVGLRSSGALSVLLGDGLGGFGAPTVVPVLKEFGSLTGGDLDADGDLDLVALDHSINETAVLVGQGDGSFQIQRYAAGEPRSVLSDVVTRALAMTDMNGDGVEDLVQLDHLNRRVLLIPGR